MLAKLRKIAKSLWLLVATSGLVSIVVGLVAMIRPQLVLSVFIYLFGVFLNAEQGLTQYDSRYQQY